MADERNFRSSYYEKVGCNSVEEKKSLSILLDDKTRNRSKLKQFCLSYTVPTAQRGLLWSIILGVLPLFKNSAEYIMEQREQVYQDLLRAVTIMQYIDHNTPKSRIFYAMWLLETNKLYLHTNIYDDHSFVEIVGVLLQIFDTGVDTYTYWIAKEFYKQTLNIQDECPRLKEVTQTLLKREDINLYNHLEKYNIFSSSTALDKWYATCFAGIIGESALIKVWDKICGGSHKILIFIMLEIVKSFRDAIMACTSREEIKKVIEQVKDQDLLIVNKAIKTWQSNKTHSEIAVH